LHLKLREAGTSFTVPPASVMVAEADLVESATEVATMVTAALVGSEAGAAKVVAAPLGVVVG
jgi:hypothetical protein